MSLKYTQVGGFVDFPEDGIRDNENLSEALSRLGFEHEESDGEMDVREEHVFDAVIEYWYNDKGGARVTVANSASRYEVIFTDNAADFFALRALLAPIALIATFDGLMSQLAERGLIGDSEDARRQRRDEQRREFAAAQKEREATGRA